MGLWLAAPAAGQVAWDAPMLMAPNSPAGLGIFLVEVDGPRIDGQEEDGIGGLATWRRAPVPDGIGFRVGLFEDPFDDIALTAGIDVSGTLLQPSGELPIGFIWLFGAGLGIGDEVWASFPLGISAGIDLESDGVLFRPYLTPRVALDVMSGPGDEIDLSAAVDVGLDLAFSSDWVIRFGAAVGDRDAIAVGLQFPGVAFY